MIEGLIAFVSLLLDASKLYDGPKSKRRKIAKLLSQLFQVLGQVLECGDQILEGLNLVKRFKPYILAYKEYYNNQWYEYRDRYKGSENAIEYAHNQRMAENPELLIVTKEDSEFIRQLVQSPPFWCKNISPRINEFYHPNILDETEVNLFYAMNTAKWLVDCLVATARKQSGHLQQLIEVLQNEQIKTILDLHINLEKGYADLFSLIIDKAFRVHKIINEKKAQQIDQAITTLNEIRSLRMELRELLINKFEVQEIL